MRLMPMGDTGLLVDLTPEPSAEPRTDPRGDHAIPARPAGPLALHSALVQSPSRPAGVLDLIPAAATLLVRFDPRVVGATAVARWVTAVGGNCMITKEVAAGRGPDAGLPLVPVTIEVVYDGDDLSQVGRLTGLGAAGVIAAHTGTPWTVAFTGFAPGFGYLVGGDARLEVPRLAAPRARVPAGAVALAGSYSGVYPRSSPGGWQLIGRTSAQVWRLDRDPPALLRPGVTVQFVAVR